MEKRKFGRLKLVGVICSKINLISTTFELLFNIVMFLLLHFSLTSDDKLHWIVWEAYIIIFTLFQGRRQVLKNEEACAEGAWVGSMRLGGLGQSPSRPQFLWILGLIQAFSDDVLECSMDLYDRAAYKFEGGLGALYFLISDFARVAAPYLHSALRL